MTTLDFKQRQKARKKKTRTCKKGFNCGNSCINKRKKCKRKFSDQAATYAGWLKKNGSPERGKLYKAIEDSKGIQKKTKKALSDIDKTRSKLNGIVSDAEKKAGVKSKKSLVAKTGSTLPAREIKSPSDLIQNKLDSLSGRLTSDGKRIVKNQGTFKNREDAQEFRRISQAKNSADKVKFGRLTGSDFVDKSIKDGFNQIERYKQGASTRSRLVNSSTKETLNLKANLVDYTKLAADVWSKREN